MSKETKFTEGPWIPYVAVQGKAKTIAIFDSSNNERDPVINWPGFDSCDKPLEEKIANAHLIAAAPDMYEALEMVAGMSGKNNWKHIQDIAKETLAKARGES